MWYVFISVAKASQLVQNRGKGDGKMHELIVVASEAAENIIQDHLNKV